MENIPWLVAAWNFLSSNLLSILGLIVAFVLGCVFCALDIYQTIESSDFQSENLFKSTYVNAFIAANGVISASVFLVTCIYQGSWIEKIVGQDIENPLLRGAVVGIEITVIIRSRLVNLQGNGANTGGFGIDAGYSAIRTLVLRKLNLMTTMKVKTSSARASTSVKRRNGYQKSEFYTYVRTSVDDIIESMYRYDVPRRDRIKEQFARSTSSEDLVSEETLVKLAMNFCGHQQVQSLIDEWVSNH